jgi:hypothetical protein
MQMGGVRLEQNKTAEAVAYFDQAAKLSPNPVLADLAGLNSALALLDTAPYKDVEARLTPLMGEKSPYRVQAKEALAFAKLRAGDLAGARGDFLVLSSSLDNSSDEIRERARGAMAMIDSGSAKDLPAVVKAAIALPPSAALALPPGRKPTSPPIRPPIPMSRRPMTTKRYLLLTAMMTAAVSVAGCSTISKINPFDKKEANKTLATQGQRISVIAFDQKVEQAEALKGATSSCPSPPSRPIGRCRAATPSSRSSTWPPPPTSTSPGARASARRPTASITSPRRRSPPTARSS